MEKIEHDSCINCGAYEFNVSDGYKICKYCNSKFRVEPVKKAIISTISLQSDIDRLLQKCRDEPQNSKKYAALVLDIDPTNQEAKGYFFR